MRNVFVYLSCILHFVVFSQNPSFDVKYEVVLNNIKSEYLLSVNSTGSFWKETSLPNPVQPNPNYIYNSNYDFKELLKDYTKKQVFSNYKVFGKNFLVKDPFGFYEWELLPDSTQIILGYVCKMAKTVFRGREYIAYYTPEISVPDGPWKFLGLPGLILKVESINNNETYSFEALELKTETTFDFEATRTKYFKTNKDKNFIDWLTFESEVQLYAKKRMKFLASNAEDADGMSVATITIDNYPEIFFKELQTKGLSIQY